MLTSLVEHIDPLTDDQSIVGILDVDQSDEVPWRETHRMGIRNSDGLVYRLVVTRGIGEAVRVVRRLQKLGFMEEDCRVPDLGCSSTFRRRKN